MREVIASCQVSGLRILPEDDSAEEWVLQPCEGEKVCTVSRSHQVQRYGLQVE